MTDSKTKASASTDALLFPAFICGEHTPCRGKMKAEAKKWGKAYLAGREFPEPKLVPIAPGSVVFTDRSSADLARLGYNFIPNTNMVMIDGETARQQGKLIQWRLYLIDNLLHETDEVAQVPYEERFAYHRAYMSFLCKYAWGTSSIATQMSLFNSIEFTVPRIEALLRFWEALDQLKYVDLETYPVSLSTMLHRYFNGQITMWVDEPTGNIRTDLQTAMEQMRQASADEIYTRLLRRLRERVDSKQDLENRDWLRSPGIIERGIENERNNGQHWYDNLTSGQNGELGGFLVSLGRHYGPGGDLTLP